MDRTISTSWSLISPDTGSSNSPEFSKLSCAEGSSDNGDDGMSSKLNMSWFPRAALAGELSVPYPLSRFPEDGLLIFLSLEHTEKAEGLSSGSSTSKFSLEFPLDAFVKVNRRVCILKHQQNVADHICENVN